MKGLWCPFKDQLCQTHAGCEGCMIYQEYVLTHKPARCSYCKNDKCDGCEARERYEKYLTEIPAIPA